MRFFFDNTLPPRLAKAIEILAEGDGHEIKHLRDRFAEDVKDTVWIPELAAERDWIVISGDVKITTARHEREAWFQSGLIGQGQGSSLVSHSSEGRQVRAARGFSLK